MLHDKSNMGPNRLKVEYMAYLNNNLLFLLADVLECQLMECEKTNRDAGYQLRHEQKRYLNGAIQNLRKLRGETRHLTVDEQESYGNDAEMIGDLIYAAVSRTGKTNDKMVDFIQYIMSFPDTLGLDDFRKYGGEAFNAILRSIKSGNYGIGPTSRYDDVKPNIQ